MDFWTAFFANLPATIMALGSLVGVIISHYKGIDRDKKIEEVHGLVNGLAEVREKAAGNKGFDAGEAGRANPTKQ